MGHNHGIDHPAVDRDVILTDKKLALIDFTRNLLRPHPMPGSGQDVNYSLFNLHTQNA